MLFYSKVTWAPLFFCGSPFSFRYLSTLDIIIFLFQYFYFLSRDFEEGILQQERFCMTFMKKEVWFQSNQRADEKQDSLPGVECYTTARNHENDFLNVLE